MTLTAAFVLSMILPPPVLTDVTKDDVLRLLAAHTSEPVIVSYIQEHAPAPLLSTQDILDLRSAGASDGVISAMISASPANGAPGQATPEDFISVGPDYVVENPEYYPYYYVYYPHYYPYFYTYPGFSFYFYWPFYYHVHSYPVHPFPYYGHEGWRYHPAYPYHPGGWGYHPWVDHHGFQGYHPHGAVPHGAQSGGPHGGTPHH
jgi:hypothetical protein